MRDFENAIGIIEKEERDIYPGTETKPVQSMKAPDNGSFETIIIGGGPAGMTAGVYLSRKMINTLLISPELGGQVLWTSDVENYPGYDVISGFELAMKFKEQLEENRIYLRIGDSVETLDIHDNSNGGILHTKQGAEYSFKSLIVASGKRSKLLNVPGEKEFTGKGVTYCATCDGPLYRNQNVAVIGGGNSALTAANDLLSLGCTVNVINFLPGLQADEILIEKAKAHGRIEFYTHYEVDEIYGETTVSGIKIHNRETGESTGINVTGVFIEIGLIPNVSFAGDIFKMNDDKEILINCRCETNIPGIYAAGDVTNVPDKQIIIAAGEGAKAALGVSKYLLNN